MKGRGTATSSMGILNLQQEVHDPVQTKYMLPDANRRYHTRYTLIQIAAPTETMTRIPGGTKHKPFAGQVQGRMTVVFASTKSSAVQVAIRVGGMSGREESHADARQAMKELLKRGQSGWKKITTPTKLSHKASRPLLADKESVSLRSSSRSASLLAKSC
jgi:hypothetical protein